MKKNPTLSRLLSFDASAALDNLPSPDLRRFGDPAAPAGAPAAPAAAAAPASAEGAPAAPASAPNPAGEFIPLDDPRVLAMAHKLGAISALFGSKPDPAAPAAPASEPAVPPSLSKAYVDSLLSQNKDLASKLAEKEAAEQLSRGRELFSGAAREAGVRFASTVAAEKAFDHLLKNYEFRDGAFIDRRTNSIFFSPDGGVGNLTGLLKRWASDPETNFFFDGAARPASMATTSAPRGTGLLGSGFRAISREEVKKDPGIMVALVKSGQDRAYLEGQPVDIEKLNQHRPA